MPLFFYLSCTLSEIYCRVLEPLIRFFFHIVTIVLYGSEIFLLSFFCIYHRLGSALEQRNHTIFSKQLHVETKLFRSLHLCHISYHFGHGWGQSSQKPPADSCTIPETFSGVYSTILQSFMAKVHNFF